MEDALNQLSFEELTKYLFGELSEAEYARVEAIVLEEPYYLGMVNNLMDFCDKENIHNRSDLLLAIEKQKAPLFEGLKEYKPEDLSKGKKDDRKNRIGWWLFLPLLLLIGFAIFNLFDDNSPTLPPIDEEKVNPTEPTDIPDNKGATPLPSDAEKLKKTNYVDSKTKPIDGNTKPSIKIDNEYFTFDPLSNNRIALKSEDLMLYYDSAQYEKVIAILEPEIALLSGSSRAKAELYLVKSYLHTAQYEEAEQLLLKVQGQSRSTLIKSDISWYLSRVYLLTNRKEKGAALLKTLSDGPYRFAAKELLDLLEISG